MAHDLPYSRANRDVYKWYKVSVGHVSSYYEVLLGTKLIVRFHPDEWPNNFN